MREQLKRLLSEANARVLVIAHNDMAAGIIWRSIERMGLGLNSAHKHQARGKRGQVVYIYTEKDVVAGCCVGLDITNVLHTASVGSAAKDMAKPLLRSTKVDSAKFSIEKLDW